MTDFSCASGKDSWNKKKMQYWEELIACVQDNPCLYSKSDPRHADKQYVQNVYRCIAEHMSNRYPGMTAKDCEADFVSLKRKFKTERLNIIKKKSGSGTSFEPLWLLYNSMRFIEPFIELRATSWIQYFSSCPVSTEQQSSGDVYSNSLTGESDYLSENSSSSESATENGAAGALTVPKAELKETGSNKRPSGSLASGKSRGQEKKKKKNEPDYLDAINTAVLKDSLEDDASLFGKLVTNKLRSLTKRNQRQATRKILDILDELEEQQEEGNIH